MDTSFKYLAEKISSGDHRILDVNHENHKGLVKMFSDLRIAGLQGITDYIFSNAGEIKDFAGVDITEFFLPTEQFGKGFMACEKALGPALNYRVENGFGNLKGLSNFIKNYENFLFRHDEGDLKECIKNLADKGIDNATKLYNQRFMDCDENVCNFKDKNVIVTGSDTGIGRGIALEFARRGAKVVLHYPTQEFKRGAFSAKKLIKEGTRNESYLFWADFRINNEISSFCNKIKTNLHRGCIDIIINTAGITMNKSLEKTTLENFDNVISVNLKAPYFITQQLAENMPNGGRIINMASGHGLRGMAGHSVYAATKAGISALTRNFAMELAPRGIRVNAVVPGWVAGVNHFKLMNDLNFNEESKNASPLGYISDPGRFAKAVVGLCSEDFSDLNGQTIPIDCGMYAGMGPECTEVCKYEFGKNHLR